MAQELVKEMKIGLSNQDKQDMADDIYDRVGVKIAEDKQEIVDDVNDYTSIPYEECMDVAGNPTKPEIA